MATKKADTTARDLRKLAQQHAAHKTGIHPSEMKAGSHPTATKPKVKKRGTK